MKPKIVVVGTAHLGVTVPVDAFPVQTGPTRHPQWVRTEATGVGANVAGACAALGSRVELCTVVGADHAGDLIRSCLRTRGLLGRGVVTAERSTVAVDLVGGDGSRAGHSFLRPIEDETYPEALFAELVEGADAAVLTTAGLSRPLLAAARRAGVPVATDLHQISDIADEDRSAWLHAADILFCSHERLPASPREWIASVFAAYPGCAVAGVGCGAEGAVLGLRDGTLVRARTELPRSLISVIGAGDTLFATFLHSWLSTGQPVRALSDAVLHAAWRIGATRTGDTLLTADQLRALARTHPVEVELGRWDLREGRIP
ncbi:carbohydrate kinase family protein [Nocardiopsis coralliicola]